MRTTLPFLALVAVFACAGEDSREGSRSSEAASGSGSTGCSGLETRKQALESACGAGETARILVELHGCGADVESLWEAFERSPCLYTLSEQCCSRLMDPHPWDLWGEALQQRFAQCYDESLCAAYGTEGCAAFEECSG